MGEVIQMPVVPKTAAFKVGQHDVTLTYFPLEPAYQRWKWAVRYVQIKAHFGYAASIEQAGKDARKRIATLTDRNRDHA